MKKVFELFEEDGIWMFLLYLVCAVILCLIFIGVASDHKIRYYYLENSEGVLEIRADRNWGADKTMELDRSITYDKAIDMVSRMNEDLEKLTIE